MKRMVFILLLLFAVGTVYSQEYEIAWEKDIDGSYSQFSKNGEFIYVANGSLIQKYRSSDGSFVSTFDYGSLQSLGITHNFCISKTGKYIISGSAIDKTNGYIYIWDTKTEKAIKRLNIGYCDFIDDNRMIITEYQNPAEKLMIYDFHNEKILSTKQTNYNFYLVKVSNNGKLIATASKTSGGKCYLTLWDTETLSEINKFEIEGGQTTTFYEIKFSFDDKYVGISTFIPYNALIFDTQKFVYYKSSKSINQEFTSAFAFLQNKFVFANNDFSTIIYKIYLVNNSNFEIEQNFPIISEGINTSSNGYIFTKHALLRPKTIDVKETTPQNITVTTIKDLLIIDNKSEWNEETTINLFDLNGKEILRISNFLNNGLNKFTIPKSIPNSAYILHLNSKSVNISQKILIQR